MARTTFIRSKRPHYNRLSYFGALIFFFFFSKINGAPCAFKAEGVRGAGRQATVFCLKTSTCFTRIYFEDGATVEGFPVTVPWRRQGCGSGMALQTILQTSPYRWSTKLLMQLASRNSPNQTGTSLHFAFDTVSFSISALEYCSKNMPLLFFQFVFSRCPSLRHPRFFLWPPA